jgi:hypothetical protein
VTLYVVGPDISALPEQDNGFLQLPGRYGLPASNEYERMAKALGGKFYDITRNSDFIGIIDEIGEMIAKQYKLTYRTPHPSPDGTLRDIRVKVSKEGQSGGSGGVYLERHLLNVKSSPQVGLACLLTLLVALLVPAALKLRPAVIVPLQSATAQGVHPTSPAGSVEPTYPPQQMGKPPGGAWPPQVPTAPLYPPAPAAPTTCLRCGGLVHPGARFCPRCGAPQSAANASGIAPTVCPRCDNVIKLNVKFCNRCGHQLR